MVSSLSLNKLTCFALYSTSLAMTKAYKPLLAKLELTYPQYLVLISLDEKQPMTVSEIGACVFLDSGTLTPLLKKLEALGYVQRLRDKLDERIVNVSLTPKGKALNRKAAEIPSCIAEASGHTVEQLNVLNLQLQKLRTSLHNSL
jgi:MarR family transcriptional regulator, organic hydroperoxide resistance regulator